ncbi:MAG: Uma2 family endonuclease [Sphingobacteriales bacterium]|nr:Uma2 family endonuclease [Sphingobacteriales bacterium]MBI3720417.1 Uma2 family endonuclease [Sphingobacteriales bacterium]
MDNGKLKKENEYYSQLTIHHSRIKTNLVFTVYNDDNDNYSKVEEPDPSLNYTYADYLQWKFEERLELIKGKIFKMSPAPNVVHQAVSMKLSSSIYNFLKGKSCKIFSAPFDVRLPVKNKKKDNEIYTVVQPDICVICDESKLDERGCCGAPDLIIEILSPGNSRKEVKLKFDLYEEAGVKEYWIISPAEETVLVYFLQEDGKYIATKMLAAGEYVKSKVVEEFEIEVSEIFSN